MKTVYIAGALTGRNPQELAELRQFYEHIGDACRQFGLTPYLPHQYSDPELAARLTPAHVDRLDRLAVTQAYLVVAYVGIPSLGVGIEVEMAHHANKPVVLVYEASALERRHVSRLMRGNPGVIHEIAFEDRDDAVEQIRDYIKTFAFKIQDEHLPEPFSLAAEPSDS